MEKKTNMPICDNIQQRNGGTNKANWTPADWAIYLESCNFMSEDMPSLMEELKRMPHWQTVEWWNILHSKGNKATSIDDIMRGGSRHEMAEYCFYLGVNLLELICGNFSSWRKLRTYLGYTLGKRGEIDNRVNLDYPVSIANSNICITGRLSLPDDFYRALIIEAGGKCSKYVNFDTNYLIVGEWAGVDKMDEAEGENIPLCSEQALRSALCDALGVNDTELDAIAPAMERKHPRSIRGERPFPRPEWMKICITGKLDKPRKVYHAAIKEAGGHPLEDVTANCQLLVVGGSPGSKLKRAEILGIPICALDDFKKMLAERGIALPQ